MASFFFGCYLCIVDCKVCSRLIILILVTCFLGYIRIAGSSGSISTGCIGLLSSSVGVLLCYLAIGRPRQINRQIKTLLISYCGLCVIVMLVLYCYKQNVNVS